MLMHDENHPLTINRSLQISWILRMYCCYSKLRQWGVYLICLTEFVSFPSMYIAGH